MSRICALSDQLVSYKAVHDFKRTTLKMHFLKNIKELCWLRQEDHEDASSDFLLSLGVVCLLFFLPLFCRMKEQRPPCRMSCCHSPTGAMLLGLHQRACAQLQWLRPRTPVLGWLLLGASMAGRHHSQPGPHTQPLVPLKAQPDFLLLKRERKPRTYFFTLPSNSDRKTDPSLEEALSDEHSNKKWEEAREAASCQWELAAGGRRFGCWVLAGNTPHRAVLRPVLPAGQPAQSLWGGTDRTTLTVQYEETKQDKISK